MVESSRVYFVHRDWGTFSRANLFITSRLYYPPAAFFCILTRARRIPREITLQKPSFRFSPSMFGRSFWSWYSSGTSPEAGQWPHLRPTSAFHGYHSDSQLPHYYLLFNKISALWCQQHARVNILLRSEFGPVHKQAQAASQHHLVFVDWIFNC